MTRLFHICYLIVQDCIYLKGFHILKFYLAQSAGAVEYTDCFSAEGNPHNECTGYDTKQSDSKVPVMLELWGIRGIPLLPSFEGPLCPGVVAPDRVLSMGQIELNCVLMIN